MLWEIQRFVLDGVEWENKRTLQEYNIADGSTVYAFDSITDYQEYTFVGKNWTFTLHIYR